MFTTTNDARVILELLNEEIDGYYWDAVRIDLWEPCFLLAYEHGELCSTLVLSKAAQVRNAVLDPELSIRGISVLLPASHPEHTQWQISPLRSLVVCREKEIEHYQEAYIFTFCDGSQRIESAIESTEEQLERLETWFSMEQHAIEQIDVGRKAHGSPSTD
ncbi:MAG: hypothetical protein OXC69_09110 [Candidatus Tectomicrobia bacterium]|nr:hypothetical protein [Candidatus Tectomicrobia bacterium]